MSQNLNNPVARGVYIVKNSFHVVGPDDRGAIALRQKWSRGQTEPRLANMPPCLIGMPAIPRGDFAGGRLASNEQ
jgi:transposase